MVYVGSGGARRPALAPGARPAHLDADRGDRGRGHAVLLTRRPPRSGSWSTARSSGRCRSTAAPCSRSATASTRPAATGDADGYVYFEVDSGIARMPRVGRRRSSWSTTCCKRKEIGAEWPVLLPGAKGIVFRTRRANQAAARFPDRGDEAARAASRRCSCGASTRGTRRPGTCWSSTADGKLVAAAVRPRQAGADGLADRAARGDRRRGQRVLHQPRPVGERHPGVHDRRRRRRRAARCG